MFAKIGEIGLTVSFFSLLVSSVLSIRSLRSQKPGEFLLLIPVSLLGITASLAALLIACAVGDFRLIYVTRHTDLSLGVAYRISAAWAGREGSLLFWSWASALFVAALYSSTRSWREKDRLITMLPAQLFLLVLSGVLWIVESPFAQMPHRVSDGLGMNPLLENTYMLIHPPLLFFGYAASIPPFCLMVSGIVFGRVREKAVSARIWVLIAWMLMTSGIILGSAWAYSILGWGGYWGWDPVENASLLPWLTLTALLHAISSTRRRHAMVEWVFWLAVVSFELCVFAAFITRSGVLSSVHAFAESITGWVLLGVIVVSSLFVVILTWRRRNALSGRKGKLDFRITVISLTAFAVVVAAGTLAGSNVRWYTLFAIPMGALLVPLIIYCMWRFPKRIHSLMIHVGVILFILGAAFSALEITSIEEAEIGWQRNIGGYSFALSRIVTGDTDRYEYAQAVFSVTDSRGRTRQINSGLKRYRAEHEVMADVGIDRGLLKDISIVTHEIKGNEVSFEIKVIRLISLIWLGAGLAVLGALVGLLRSIQRIGK